jgi:hypothetical protein
MFKAKYSKRFTKEYERFFKYDKETAAKIKMLKDDVLEYPACGLGSGLISSNKRGKNRRYKW